VIDCPDCTKARAGVWPLYRSNCHGCVARQIARSQEAWNAMHPAGTLEVEPLSAMVDRMMADVPRDQAADMVREWVRHDRRWAA
jgi:hypothetical protein